MAMGGIGASSYQEEEEGEEEGTQPLHRMNDDMNDDMNNGMGGAGMGGDGMGDKRLIISELEADLGIDLTSRLDFVQRVLDGIASEARKHGK